MPEIMEASFADGKIQIFDRMVDISFMYTNPQNLFKEEMKPDAFAYVEAHKSGTFQELYDWAVNYGFISAEYGSTGTESIGWRHIFLRKEKSIYGK